MVIIKILNISNQHVHVKTYVMMSKGVTLYLQYYLFYPDFS